MPLAPEAQGVFTIVTHNCLFTPTRVPQKVLNATSYFQGVMTDLLRVVDSKVWVDDVFSFVEDEIPLLCLMDEDRGRSKSVGFSSPLTSTLFMLANWFGVAICFLMVSCRIISPV